MMHTSRKYTSYLSVSGGWKVWELVLGLSGRGLPFWWAVSLLTALVLVLQRSSLRHPDGGPDPGDGDMTLSGRCTSTHIRDEWKEESPHRQAGNGLPSKDQCEDW
jgi:hypothetical protein